MRDCLLLPWRGGTKRVMGRRVEAGLGLAMLSRTDANGSMRGSMVRPLAGLDAKCTRKAACLDRHRIRSLIYPLAVTISAVALLMVMAATGRLFWSYTMAFLAVACIFSEWLVIRLPQGDSITATIIFILLALLLNFEPASAVQRAIGTIEIAVIGALIGHGLARRPPFLHLAFYAAHYVWAATLAGLAFVLASERVPSWFLTSFHVPAVLAYVVVFSLASMLMVEWFNKRILRGDQLPKADLLYTAFMAPIALIFFYFSESRHLTLASLLILAVPLIGVLVTFRLYINIDTTYGEVNQLYAISQEFVAAMSQEETVQKACESIGQAVPRLLVHLDACLVYTHNDKSNEYVLVNASDDQPGPPIILPGHGLLGRTIFEGAGTIVNDLTLQDALSPQEREWPPRTAVLAHPMFAERRQVGLLVLVRYGKRFTAEEFRLVGIVANQAGVTLHNAQLYERSRQMADTDRQLDVLNQSAFTQRSERIMGRARTANQPVALLYGDVDDFRLVNNTYGHHTGDLVLAGVARLMKQVVGESGFVGRSAGEEFFILLPNMGDHQAAEMADEIRQRVDRTVFTSDDSREFRTTISAGVAVFPRDAGDIVTLIKQADRAAYLAKRMGKNRVCLYEDRREIIESMTRETEAAVAGAVPKA